VIVNGWASFAEADAMFLEDLAEICEHADMIADAQEHAQRHMIPRGR